MSYLHRLILFRMIFRLTSVKWLSRSREKEGVPKVKKIQRKNVKNRKRSSLMKIRKEGIGLLKREKSIIGS
mgnify:FL=1